MFLRQICVPEAAVAADGVYTFDLAVNPLSVILINLRPLNDTGTLANYSNWLQTCKAVNRVSVLYNGMSIVNMRGEDAAALMSLRHGITPMEGNPDNTDNERRCVQLPIFMGRHAYDPRSCFPATRRGELVLELDLDIADTGYDSLRLSVDTIELPGAKPKEYERKNAINYTFPATGDNDIDLPLGNKLRGCLLFGTTGYDGAAPVPSWGRVKLLLDNQEQAYGAVDWEALMAEPFLYGRRFPSDDHRHTLDATVAGITNTTSVYWSAGSDLHNYAMMDFDPTGDDEHTLDVSKAKRIMLRATAETADAVRVVPVEVIAA
jgi:hypothetical protein